MKRYIVFAGFTYYSSPGWQGFNGEFDDINEAIKHGKETEVTVYDGVGWWQVVDLERNKIVAGKGKAHTGLFGEVLANPSTNE